MECECCGDEITDEDREAFSNIKECADMCLACKEEFVNDNDLFDDDHYEFASPGSALRAETPDNPRNLPCPTCGEPNRLTPLDRSYGYQCDSCADIAEGKCLD